MTKLGSMILTVFLLTGVALLGVPLRLLMKCREKLMSFLAATLGLNKRQPLRDGPLQTYSARMLNENVAHDDAEAAFVRASIASISVMFRHAAVVDDSFDVTRACAVISDGSVIAPIVVFGDVVQTSAHVARELSATDDAQSGAKFRALLDETRNIGEFVIPVFCFYARGVSLFEVPLMRLRVGAVN